jgi:Xaa-Pro aminopeptidase
MNINIKYPDRLRKVQCLMKQQGLKAYVGMRFSTLSYLTGVFIPWRCAVVMPDEGPLIGIWFERDADRIIHESWISDHRIWGSTEDLLPAVARTLTELGLAESRIGVEFRGEGGRGALGVLCAFEYEELKNRLPHAHFEEGRAVLDEAMVIKEKEEIALLRQAAAIADAGLLAVRDFIRPGLTENQVAGEAERAMRDLGNEWNWSLSGGTEVGSGPRSAFAGGFTQPATGKVIQQGENIILDLHPMYRLYMADACFNLVVGKPSEKQLRLAEVWEKTAKVLLENIHDGVRIADAARAANSVLQESEFAPYSLLGYFGHGLGVDTRVPPTINLKNESTFRENMTIAAGVHIYVPGLGGMRMELPALVGKTGAEPLCKLGMKLHVTA